MKINLNYSILFNVIHSCPYGGPEVAGLRDRDDLLLETVVRVAGVADRVLVLAGDLWRKERLEARALHPCCQNSEHFC